MPGEKEAAADGSVTYNFPAGDKTMQVTCCAMKGTSNAEVHQSCSPFVSADSPAAQIIDHVRGHTSSLSLCSTEVLLVVDFAGEGVCLPGVHKVEALWLVWSTFVVDHQRRHSISGAYAGLHASRPYLADEQSSAASVC